MITCSHKIQSPTKDQDGQVPSLREEYNVGNWCLSIPSITRSDFVDGLDRSSFSPFAARTQQYVKEQLGTADDKVHIIAVLEMPKAF